MRSFAFAASSGGGVNPAVCRIGQHRAPSRVVAAVIVASFGRVRLHGQGQETRGVLRSRYRDRLDANWARPRGLEARGQVALSLEELRTGGANSDRSASVAVINSVYPAEVDSS